MNSQRILVLGGLLLFLAGLVYGLYYDGIAAGERYNTMLYNIDMAVNMAAKGDITTASAFVRDFGSADRTQIFQARISYHLVMAGAATMLPLWLITRLDMSERIKRLLALLLVTGGGLLAVGDYFSLTSPRSAGYYVILAGYAWMAFALFGFFSYALLFGWLNQEDKKRG
ncbi:Hypothetical protein LUCI_1155 [Lucifera butyrica]|uniref:Uncharacterized protein n=1 Tax=Lucifera butyrica TaxID=1351585 RepID=A0A498R3G2_9FIRM|nr:hypothetical protein [Lucifera butyrica]VBB05944.1 Hypothetical protein LUCI_1155 [Lucifera butyrica]